MNKQLVTTCIENSPVGNEMGTEQTLGNYIDGGYNTYNKRPWQHNEMLQLPQFSGTVRHKLEMRRRGKEVGE